MTCKPDINAGDDLPAQVWSHRDSVSIEYNNTSLVFTPQQALRIAALLMDAADCVIERNEGNKP